MLFCVEAGSAHVPQGLQMCPEGRALQFQKLTLCLVMRGNVLLDAHPLHACHGYSAIVQCTAPQLTVTTNVLYKWHEVLPTEAWPS